MRVAVIGASGAGKSTFCRQLSTIANVPYVEMDSLYWQPEWTPNPAFIREVQRLTQRDTWITEWQYADARRIIADNADLFIYLNYPRWLVMCRVIRRTLHRRIFHTPVCNGNTEPPLSSIFTDPEHIVRWSWASYTKYAQRWQTLQVRYPEKSFLSFSSPRQARRWLSETAPQLSP